MMGKPCFVAARIVDMERKRNSNRDLGIWSGEETRMYQLRLRAGNSELPATTKVPGGNGTRTSFLSVDTRLTQPPPIAASLLVLV